MATPSISWMKLPIVGLPGADCGYELLPGAETRRVDTFKVEFGECVEPGRWMAGMLFLCDKHAAIVAESYGDNLDAIAQAIREQL